MVILQIRIILMANSASLLRCSGQCHIHENLRKYELAKGGLKTIQKIAFQKNGDV